MTARQWLCGFEVCAASALGVTSVAAQQHSRAPARTTSEIAAMAIPATVTIYALSARGDTLGLGSGFFVTRSGALLTNWHVMSGASRALIVRPSGERYEGVAFIDGDSALDLAVLKVPAQELPFLELRPTTPSVGERVVTIGSPLGLGVTVSDGIVSATRVREGHEYVQITAPISPGSSGGAVLDEQGQVFAMTTWTFREGQQLNFAVPIRYALAFLQGEGRPRSLASAFATRRVVAVSEARPRWPDGGGHALSPPSDRQPWTPATPAERQPWTPLPLPEASPAPLPLLEGTWNVQREVTFDSLSVRLRAKGMLLASGEVGWLVLGEMRGAPSDAEPDRIVVYPVSSLRSTARGEVVLDASSQIYDGYQSATGFVLTTEGRTQAGVHFLTNMVATRSSLRASSNSGLYGLSASTVWTPLTGEPRGGALPWDGIGAIVTVNDSIYVDFQFKNPLGGTSSFWGSAPLANTGTFSIKSGAGATLDGYVRAGMIIAEWRDQQPNGAFTGRVRAERR